MKKKIISCCLILIVLVFSGFSWYYSTKTAIVVPYTITINGTDLDLENDIITVDGSTYIPLREVAQYYGAAVEWDEKEKTISVNFDSSLIPFKKGIYWGLADINHKIVIEPKYSNIYNFSEGLARVNTSTWTPQYGYINEKGDEVISCIYYSATDFCDGFAFVSDAETYEHLDLGKKCFYFIDKYGKNVFGQKFEGGFGFSEGYAGVITAGEIAMYSELYPPQWEYIDITGKIISKEKYEDAYPFVNGYAVVKKDGIWKVIDKSFECVQNLEFQNEDDAFEFAKELRAK